MKTRSDGDVYALAKHELLGESNDPEAGAFALTELFQRVQ